MKTVTRARTRHQGSTRAFRPCAGQSKRVRALRATDAGCRVAALRLGGRTTARPAAVRRCAHERAGNCRRSSCWNARSNAHSRARQSSLPGLHLPIEERETTRALGCALLYQSQMTQVIGGRARHLSWWALECISLSGNCVHMYMRPTRACVVGTHLFCRKCALPSARFVTFRCSLSHICWGGPTQGPTQLRWWWRVW